MSEFSTGFVFDLQRFATKTFNGGAVGDETGVTLSDLFNNAGRAWLYSNASKGVAEGQTFFWEKSALVELNPAVDNANETVAGALELVSGRYDDPTVDDQDVTVIKRVDAIDAENLTGAANFKTIGSTTIVNPGAGATIAIGNNTLTFGGGGNDNKDTDSSLAWDVGTRINVTNGSIKNVQAAATEEITTANGTTADFANGGTATFSGKAFNTIESFASGGSAGINVYGDDAIILEVEETSTPVNDGKTAITTTFDGQTIKSVAFAGNANSVSADIAFGGTANVGKDIAIANGTVNVANIAGASATPVVYRLGAEGGDILDLTNTEKASSSKNISVSKTGKARFLLANDENADGEDGAIVTDTISIGGTNYKFNDAQANGGVFVVSNNAVTGFVFRDAGDAIVIPAGASLTLYNGRPATESELSVGDNNDNMSFADIDSLPVNFAVSSDSEYMVTKTEDGGFTVEVFDGTTVTVGDATFDFTLVTNRGNSKSPASAVLTFGSDGLLQSISDGTTTGSTGTNNGLRASGTAVKVSGISSDNVAEGFTINNVAVNLESGEYTYEVAGEKNAEGTPQIQLNSAEETITAEINDGETAIKVLPYEGGTGKVTYLNNEYSFVNSSGDAYLYADADSLRFVFVEAGDAITIPVDAAATTELLYQDKNNDSAETAIATVPTVDNDYTVTMTTATTRRSPNAEFTISGIEADGTVTFGNATFAFNAEGGTFLFGQSGTDAETTANGFTAASGLVTLNETAAGLLAQTDADAPLFKIDGTGVNITAVVDDANESNLVYNKSENSLFGLADGSAVVNAGSLTRIYAPTNEGTFTFGDPDAETPQVYTSRSEGDAEDNERAYFTVAGDTVSGFTFAAVDDYIRSDNFSNLTLTDGPTGNSFDAPVVTEGTGDNAAPAEATLLKTTFDYDGNGTDDACYSIYQSDLDGKTVTFDDGTVATFNSAANEPEAFFSTDGKLLSIINLSTQNDEVAIQNATGAVRIDDSTVEILGGAFVYRMLEDNVPAIAEVTAGTTILQAAGVEVIATTSDETANGTYTFGSASKAYTLAGNEDGIRFIIDGDINVVGVNELTGNESVTGAFGVSSGGLSIVVNENFLKVVTDDTANEYTLSDGRLTGLKDGDAVVSAGNITEFATAEDGTFTILGASMAVAGDSAVAFTVDGEQLTAVTELSGTVTGNLTDGSVMINDARVEVVGDSNSSISVTGTEDETGIVKVGGLGGESVVVVSADGATQIGADADGTFTFAFAGGETFGIAGNSAVETTFDFANGVVAGISGIDDGEAVAGNFSNGVAINGDKFVDVDNDDLVGVINGGASAGFAIMGLSDGAIVAASGIAAAMTEGEGTFTFANGEFAIAGDSAVEFDLDNEGNVVGVTELDGAVTGALNNVTINEQEPAISVSSASGAAHDVTYDTAGILSGIADGDTVMGAASATTVNAAQEGTFTFANGTFQVEGDADGLDFLVNAGTANVYGVNGLAADATLRGALDQLLSINGASVDIKGDSSFAVVGAASGIGSIIELSGGASVINAGGASLASTDTEGSFTFNGKTFTTEGDSAVEFALNDNNVTNVGDLDGAVTSNGFSGISVNGQSFAITGDDGDLTVIGNGTGIASIAKVGGSDVTVENAGGASSIVTDKDGGITFAKSGQAFATGGGDSSITFSIDGDEKVFAIDDLNGSVAGNFDEVGTINGQAFDVKDSDSRLSVMGNSAASGIDSIALVSASATVTAVAGASTIVTDTTGSFSFAGNTNAFEVTGDNSVTFTVDENVKVTGVSDLANGSVKGELTQASVNGASIAISNDKDDIISYAVDASNVKTLGDLDVGDNGVAIVSATGNANFVNLTSDGEFDFGGKRYTFAAGGSATLAINNDTDIVSIIGVETDGDYVSGDFTSGILVQGRAVHVTGDNDITVANVGGSAFVLQNISDSAVIEEAAGISYAYTDTTGTFTDADGKKLSFASDNSVELLLDGNARFIGASGVSGAVSGDITQLPEGINGGGSIYVITAPNGDPSTNLTIDGDVLSGVKDGDTVLATDGATSVQTDESGTFTFRTGDEQQGFTLENDADGALFGLDDKGNVVSISDVDEDATLTGAVNGLLVNGSEVSIAGDRDSIFGIVGGATGIKAVDAVGGDKVTVVSAGGADSIYTDQAGVYIFEKSGDKFTVGGDSSVVFALNDGESVTAVGELEGTVAGDFTNARNVNAQRVQVTGDGDGISVVGAVDADGITAINDVDAGAVVVSSGDAAKVRTDGEGVYTFDGNVYVNAAGSLARQFASEKFSVTGDTSVTFELDNTGDVIGVSDFTSGQLEFNTTTTRAIKINPDENIPDESHNNDLNDELQFSTNDDATLTVDANGDVVGVAGIKSEYDDAGNRTKLGYVLGLENATVTATTPIYVGPNNSDVPNDKYYFEVDDGDDNYGVVVENFEPSKLTSVTGGNDTAPATVNVQDGTIEVDKDGVFNVGGEVYTVADDNDVFTMTTDENRDLTGVSGLEGTVVIADGQEELTVNGNYVEFFNGRDSAEGAATAVSISSDGTNITDVKGLNNYDIINGNLDNASIAMGSVPAGENYSALAVNDTVFALIATQAVTGNHYDNEYFVGDADGVTINGQGQVVGLDDDARMYVTEEGTYTVNGTAIKAVVGDTIVGTSNGAYLYNPDNMLVRRSTSISKIESLTGIPQHGNYDRAYGTADSPLSAEAVSEFLNNGEYDKDQSIIIYATNPDSTEPSDINFAPYRFTKQVHLFDGPQNVTLNADGGNLVHVEEYSPETQTIDGVVTRFHTSGVKNIVLGNGVRTNGNDTITGGDVVIVDEVEGIANEVNILGGAGADTVFVRENARTNFDMVNGGADKVVTFARANARINVENYDASTGAGIQFEQDEVRDSVGGIAGAIDKGIIDFGDGVISLKTASGTTEVSLNGTTGGTNGLTGGTNSIGGSVVNLFTPEGKEQKVAFTHLAGGVASVDVADTDDVILIGNKGDAKRGASTLLGGFGNDTVFAGEGDFINAYGGNNYINMAADDNREGAYIEITAGTTVIENMNNTLDQIHGDTLGIDLTTMEVEYDGTNLLVKSRTADSNVLATVVAADKDTALVYDTATETASTDSSDLAQSADEAEETTGETTTEGEDTVATAAGSPLVADHNYTNQLINSNGTLIKAAVGAKGSVIDVKKDEDVRANYYKGEDSGLVFDFYNGSVFIDLEGDWLTTGSSIDGTAVALEGINSIHAGTELNYVKGSEANETFIAGRGETHLYGDGGKNLLIGYDGTDGDKEGQTVFYVLGNAYYAANTIQAFNFVDDDNYTNNSKITADKLEFDLPTNHVSKVAVSNDDVVVEVTKNGSFVTESVVIEDAIDTVSGTAKDILIAGDGIVEDVIAQVGTDKLHFDKFANYYNATGKNATISVDNDKDYAQVWLDGSKGVNFQGDIHVIDASTFTGQAELAGNDYNNIIIASTVEGSGAQSLWGGHRGDDALIAGASQNTFFYTVGNGTDTIYGAKDGDIVNLAGVTLDQLDTANFAFSETGVKLAFKDGGALYVGDNGGNSVSYVVNGETYFVNESHNGFTKKA